MHHEYTRKKAGTHATHKVLLLVVVEPRRLVVVVPCIFIHFVPLRLELKHRRPLKPFRRCDGSTTTYHRQLACFRRRGTRRRRGGHACGIITTRHATTRLALRLPLLRHVSPVLAPRIRRHHLLLSGTGTELPPAAQVHARHAVAVGGSGRQRRRSGSTSTTSSTTTRRPVRCGS